MEKHYSSELNIQYLVALLKEHNIKRVVASPGTTNLSFVASLQCDSFFEIYSCVDERSAAYMAVGIAEETNEAVILTCTGATASRNYASGLTEAYYRKLPILCVTGTQDIEKIGNLHAQVIDRRTQFGDITIMSTYVPSIRDKNDIWVCQNHINKAILALHQNGGGPVHINLQTSYNRDFSVSKLPEISKIDYYNSESPLWPELPVGRIAIFVGAHKTFTQEEENAIDRFCSLYDAVVFCDHTSGYYGEYRLQYALPSIQEYDSPLKEIDLLIHIGEVSGDYASLAGLQKKNVWRVSPDGAVRDTFKKLTKIFAMEELTFFRHYSQGEIKSSDKQSYYNLCKQELASIYSQLPNLPFSNVYIASQTASKIPSGSELHLGILNSLRSWNFFELPKGVVSFSNVGGFGIDGCMSSMIGASLMNPLKLYFGVFGDLAFFYDMNALGNRHIGNNLRIMVVNNGRGTEFRNFYHTGSLFGDDADAYIAAAGHFGNKSRCLVKNYAENLGYRYISASSKQELQDNLPVFLDPKITISVVFEVFTDSADESKAMQQIWSIKKDTKHQLATAVIDVMGGKNRIKKFLGSEFTSFLKSIVTK